MVMAKSVINSHIKDEISLDKSYHDFFDHVPNFIAGYPAMDIKENENSYILEVELPGLSQKNIKIYLSPNLLIIKSRNNVKHETKGYTYLVQERRNSGFSRSFSLPEYIDINNTKAFFKNGLLSLHLPKRK